MITCADRSPKPGMARGRRVGDDFSVPPVSGLSDNEVAARVQGSGGGARQVLGIAVTAEYGVFANEALVAGEFDVALPVGAFAIIEG
jgi:hypothetical protein